MSVMGISRQPRDRFILAATLSRVCARQTTFGYTGRNIRDRKELIMRRERALKIALVLVGLLFCAAAYPLILMMKQDPALAMMMSLYATLGVFLVLASRDPSAHRSLIAFTAWSSFAHAGQMSIQALLNMIARRELIGSAVFAVIGIALIALAPVAPRK